MKPAFIMTKRHSLPRWFRWWLGISGAVLVLGAGFWLATSRPQLAAQRALQQLAEEDELRLQGSLQYGFINAQPVSAQPSLQGADFTMSRKDEQEYVEAKLQLEVNGASATIPLNTLQRNGAVYYQLPDASFLTLLINSSAPQEALQLVRTKALYEAKVGQSWLRANKDEGMAPFASIPRTKLQACVAAAAGSANLQKFIKTLAAAPVAIVEETQSLMKAEVHSPTRALQQLFGNNCQITEADGLTFTFDISKRENHITQFSLELIYGFERMILTASISDTKASPIPLPEPAVDASVLHKVDDETELLVNQQLAQFPELRTLIENLRRFETEQGGFNP